MQIMNVNLVLHRVTRDLLGRVEILGQQSRRHHQRRAIDRSLLLWIERLHAGQIPGRAGVFHAGRPPNHHRPRIACTVKARRFTLNDLA